MEFITFLLGIITGLLLSRAVRNRNSMKTTEENIFEELIKEENNNK